MSPSAMFDERFWDLIDQSRDGFPASADPTRLSDVLSRLNDEDLLNFEHTFYEKLCDLNNWDLWGAGYVIAGGMSDDSFHYFRSWIIGKGRKIFDLALADPDKLAPYIDSPDVDNELLEYAALKLLEKRGVKEDPRERSDRTADQEPAGAPFDEETVHRTFPNLANLASLMP